jgi:hypothetical protein
VYILYGATLLEHSLIHAHTSHERPGIGIVVRAPMTSIKQPGPLSCLLVCMYAFRGVVPPHVPRGPLTDHSAPTGNCGSLSVPDGARRCGTLAEAHREPLMLKCLSTITYCTPVRRSRQRGLSCLVLSCL